MTIMQEASDHLWVFFLIVVVLGLIGNSCVLRIYLKNKDKRPVACLTIVLACIDLAICLIIVPTQIIIHYAISPLLSSWVCEFIFWYCYGFWNLSCFILCLITFEQFASICQFHRLNISRPWIKILAIVIVMAFVISLIPAVYSHVVTVDLQQGNTTSTMTITSLPSSCDITRFLTSSDDSSFDNRRNSSKVLFAVYIFMIIFNLVVYSIIFCTLQTYERKWKMWNSRVTPMRSRISISTIGDLSDNSATAERFPCHSTRANLSSRMESQVYSPKSDRQGPAKIQYFKLISKHLMLANLVYVLSWIPFYLTEFKVINYYVFLHNLFFVTNFINPYIYIMTNSLFRKQVSTLCCH